MLRNKHAHSHSLYNITSVVVLFAYQIMLNISASIGVTKILQKKLYYRFNCMIFAMQSQNVGQNFVSLPLEHDRVCIVSIFRYL